MKKTIPMLALPALLLLQACSGPKIAAVDAPEAKPRPACAVNPAPRLVEYPWMSRARWHQMNEEQQARAAQGDIDVMFIGDSITEMWPKAVWDANFSSFKPANFGIGGDHTGNVLWRLQQPAMAKVKPKLLVLLIGTNNLGLCGESPEQVFAGIEAVVAALRAQYPGVRILLNAVLPVAALPGAPERQRVLSLNQLVRTLDDGKLVFFHDYGPRLIGSDGKLSAELQPDFLHLSEKGYRIWGDAMRPDIEKLLKLK